MRSVCTWVPQSPHALCGRRCRVRVDGTCGLLVIAPHPDDETIGAYGLMRRMRRRGATVRVVVVTDGAASHPGSTTWPRERLIRERQRETRRAMRLIGLTPRELTFLNLPDGALAGAAKTAWRAIATAARRMPKPAFVVAPADADAHPDHRVVAAGVRASRVPGIQRLTYPVWPAGQQFRGSRLLMLTATERLAKHHAIRSYRTQMGRITDDPSGFTMTAAQVAAFSRPVETFKELRR